MVFFCMETSMASPHSIPTKLPVIIDTDMGFDDWLAILYVLKNPNVKVLAITIAGTGETHCDQGLINLNRLLDLTGAPDIPTACGQEKPLLGHNVFPAIIRNTADSLNNIMLPRSFRTQNKLNALDLLNNTIINSEKAVTIVTLGPLTNIASLIQEHPEVVKHISKIVISGGAIEIPGNLNIPGIFKTDNTYAEWNMYCDPLAAEIVFSANVNKLLVPTDLTDTFPITKELIDKFQPLKSDHVVEFVLKVFDSVKIFKMKGQPDPIRLWDPVAAVSALNIEKVNSKMENLSILTIDNSNKYGSIFRSNNGNQVAVVSNLDKDFFYESFYTILSTPSESIRR